MSPVHVQMQTGRPAFACDSGAMGCILCVMLPYSYGYLGSYDDVPVRWVYTLYVLVSIKVHTTGTLVQWRR